MWGEEAGHVVVKGEAGGAPLGIGPEMQLAAEDAAFKPHGEIPGTAKALQNQP